MATEDQSNAEESHDIPAAAQSAATPEAALQKGLTPEMRRLLGGPRSLRRRSSSGAEEQRDEPPLADVEAPARAVAETPAGGAVELPQEAAGAAKPKPTPTEGAIPIRPREARPRPSAAPAAARAADATTPQPGTTPPAKQRTGGIRVDQEAKRTLGLQHIAIIAGALLLLAGAFYVGKRYQHWKYLIATRNAPVVAESFEDKFPGVPADQLVEQALAAEAAGDWRGAVDRLVAAKYKDRSYQGLFFRMGKILFDKGNHTAADGAFAKAIEFGEDLPRANHHRGLIATAARNWPAAERFFAAAAAAEPMAPDRYIHWAEALRMAGNPRDAVQRYEQASTRARRDDVRTTSLFKQRIAELEAGGAAEVEKAIAERRAAGALSPDWLLLAAALEIQRGKIERGVELIGEARAANNPLIFMHCARDMFFRRAGEKNPAVAEAVRLEFDPNQPAFR